MSSKYFGPVDRAPKDELAVSVATGLMWGVIVALCAICWLGP